MFVQEEQVYTVEAYFMYKLTKCICNVISCIILFMGTIKLMCVVFVIFNVTSNAF